MDFWLNIITLALSLIVLVVLAVIVNYVAIMRKSKEDIKVQKDELVSLAAHQLRGPLSVIQGYISLILDGDYGRVTKKMQEPLGRIFQSGTELGFLINDYLDVANIEQGNTQLIKEEFDLIQLVNDVNREFTLISKEKGVNMLVDFGKNKTIKMTADRNKTRQILTNIIDNAFKYTKTGEIKINCKVKEGAITIAVKDNGIGIRPEDLQQIFTKFERSKEAINVNVAGSGLGLFVAKSLAELQGGRVWAESAGANKGSIFYISLPVK